MYDGPGNTVTLHFAVFPSFTVAVIITVVFLVTFLAVSLPFEVTFTTLVLLDFHVTFLYLASVGLTVAVKVMLALFPNVAFLAFNLIDFTFI